LIVEGLQKKERLMRQFVPGWAGHYRASGVEILCAETMKKGRFRGLFETLKFSQSLWV